MSLRNRYFCLKYMWIKLQTLRNGCFPFPELHFFFFKFSICFGFLVPGVWKKIIWAYGDFSEDIASPVWGQQSIILPHTKSKVSVCTTFMYQTCFLSSNVISLCFSTSLFVKCSKDKHRMILTIIQPKDE